MQPQDNSLSISAFRRVALCVLLAVSATGIHAQTLTWTKVSPTTKPPARSHFAMAYDSARDRIVVFGGNGSNGEMGDTWEFDGTNWQRMSPANSPHKRRRMGMVFDPVRKRCVLYGGLLVSTLVSDTWEWDGKNWTAIEASVNPGPRTPAAMFFDHKLRKVILFGGDPGKPQKKNDTWSWDGATWRLLTTKNSPPARVASVAAYDVQRDRGVLFGGWVAPYTNVNDTWEWDGSDWTKVVTTTQPSTRHYTSMAFAGDRCILFGGGEERGRCCTSRRLNDTWSWDGQAWTLLNPVQSPPIRFAHRVVSDSKRGRVVIFGGSDSSKLLNDTWQLQVSGLTGSVASFGQGCASTSRLPTISSATIPRLGHPFPVSITGFLPKPQFGQLILGGSSATWGLIQLPLPLSIIGAGNCNLLISPDSSHLIATDAQGGFDTSFKVPSKIGLLGATAYVQAWAPDLKANPLGLATTNAIKVVVGY